MKKILNIILILIFSITVISCAKKSGGDGSSTTTQNKSPSSHTRTTLVSSSSDCPNGGVKIEMGIDDNMNGTLDSSEVDKTEYVCNGTDGTAGTDNKIKYTHYCNALLENTTLYYRYRVSQFVNEDIFIQGEIYGAAYEVADAIMYSKLQNGWDTAPIFINYDVSGSANYGYFVISLNRSTMVTTIVYTDSDVTGGSTTWTLPSSNCTFVTLF